MGELDQNVPTSPDAYKDSPESMRTSPDAYRTSPEARSTSEDAYDQVSSPRMRMESPQQTKYSGDIEYAYGPDGSSVAFPTGRGPSNMPDMFNGYAWIGDAQSDDMEGYDVEFGADGTLGNIPTPPAPIENIGFFVGLGDVGFYMRLNTGSASDADHILVFNSDPGGDDNNIITLCWNSDPGLGLNMTGNSSAPVVTLQNSTTGTSQYIVLDTSIPAVNLYSDSTNYIKLDPTGVIADTNAILPMQPTKLTIGANKYWVLACPTS